MTKQYQKEYRQNDEDITAKNTDTNSIVGSGIIGDSRLVILSSGYGRETGMKMSFGRYKGKCIFKIGDIGYLSCISDWLESEFRGESEHGMVKAIDGQILYLAKNNFGDDEDFDIVSDYVDFVSVNGNTKDAKILRKSCVDDIKKRHYILSSRKYADEAATVWHNYNRVQSRTHKKRWRNV